MNAELYNGYWISTDTYLTQQHRDSNAILVNQYLSNLGWTREAIAGILGNMDVESSINPAFIQNRGYPSLITNTQCLDIHTLGVGMVQWTGDGQTPPIGQKLASFAIRNNKQWYDGELQCYRLLREYQTNEQFLPSVVDGVTWTWNDYVFSTATPETLAKVWQYCYERGGSDTATRQAKARYYYGMIGQTLPAWLYYIMARKRKGMYRVCRWM